MYYQTNVQLKEYNSFRTEAEAKLFCKPESIDDLKRAILDNPIEDKLVLGKGCNLFFTKDYDGLVIDLNLKGIKKLNKSDDEHVYLEVQASEDWDSFISYCVENGYAGLENLSLIPGTVGASPMQNIGAYGAEVKDCIVEVHTLDKTTAKERTFSNPECEFGYRDSIFKRSNKYIIVSVVFRLNKKYNYVPKYKDLNEELSAVENPSMKEVREAVIRVRQRKLPNEQELPNAGSFFKNPSITVIEADKIQEEYPNLPRFPLEDGLIKTSAAYLVDQAGYKGVRDGDIGTYPNQPLIMVNYGSKDGNDIVRFMKKIQEAVKEKFNINLEAEVRIF